MLAMRTQEIVDNGKERLTSRSSGHENVHALETKVQRRRRHDADIGGLPVGLGKG